MQRKLRLVPTISILVLVLTSCGSSDLTPAQAAAKPCATFDMISESMLALDRASVMSYAAEAGQQFEDISSLDPAFGKFAEFLKGVAMTGSTLDSAGTYSDLLLYCIPINSPE
jgi:hypothetical protein